MEINLNEIKRGDILLVHTKKNIASWLIRKFTKNFWNHVGLFASKDDQWPKWVLEALPEGMVCRPFEIKYIKASRDDDGNILSLAKVPNYDIAVARIKDITDEQRKKIVAKVYAWTLEGRKYDKILVSLGMIFHLLSARKWRPRWLNREKEFICSEVIGQAVLEETGIKLGKYVNSGFLTPADIALSSHCEIVMSNKDIT